MLSQLLINGFVIGSGYSLIAIGHTMIFGQMNIINFAHGELYMLGAFSCYTFLTKMGGFGLGYFGALLVSAFVTMILGLILDKLIFTRIRNEDTSTSTLLTIGLSILFMNGARIIWGADPKTLPPPFKGGISIGSAMLTYSRLFIIVSSIVIILLLNFFIQKTKTGKAFRATFQNPNAALLTGIEVEKIYTINMMLGSMLAGIAGSLLSMIFILEPTMGIKAITIAWVVVVTGGRGSVSGAIIIGYLLGIVECFGGTYISSEYKDAIGFVILVLVLLIKPQGLFGKRLARMGG